MKPENLNEHNNLTDKSPGELYEAFKRTAEARGTETAVRQSKPALELTYSQLSRDADFLSRSIPFENHPVELDMNPGVGVVVAIVAALKRSCRPVAADSTSKVKLIINDNTVRISGYPPKHNPLIRYMVKGMEAVTSGRPELTLDSRRQLRRQDFLDSIIATLIGGGIVKIRN